MERGAATGTSKSVRTSTAAECHSGDVRRRCLSREGVRPAPAPARGDARPRRWTWRARRRRLPLPPRTKNMHLPRHATPEARGARGSARGPTTWRARSSVADRSVHTMCAHATFRCGPRISGATMYSIATTRTRDSWPRRACVSSPSWRRRASTSPTPELPSSASTWEHIKRISGHGAEACPTRRTSCGCSGRVVALAASPWCVPLSWWTHVSVCQSAVCVSPSGTPAEHCAGDIHACVSGALRGHRSMRRWSMLLPSIDAPRWPLRASSSASGHFFFGGAGVPQASPCIRVDSAVRPFFLADASVRPTERSHP